MRKLSFLLACCLLLSLLPGTVFSATVVASGKCGENLTWTLDSSYVLTISGTGDMAKEEGKANWGWTSYDYQIKKVIVQPGVTSIGERAFSTCWSLTSVSLPDSVKCIYDNAFNDCFMLTEIRLPVSLEYLAATAFSECSRIDKYIVPEGNCYFKNDAAGALYSKDGTVLYAVPAAFSGEFVIAEGVRTLYANTFMFQNGMTGVYIPASVENIEQDAFYNCGHLEAYRVSSENPYFEHDENGLLYRKGRKGLVKIPGAKTGTVTLADTTVWIEAGAAKNCSMIQEVILPDSLEIIENDAFHNCGDLEAIKLPDKLSFIGKYAFYRCEMLKQISIPGGEKLVSEDAFNGCYALESVEIHGGVEIIDEFAFAHCTKLESITVPESVHTIGASAFSGCEALKEIRLPESVKQIANYAFKNCPLTTVNYAGIPRQWAQVDVRTYGNDSLLNAQMVFLRNDQNFCMEEDGWNIPNHELAYGYDSDFYIHFNEYFVTGVNFKAYANALVHTSRKSWAGNCFGLSLLAAAHYNGQIDLREFFDKEGDCLNEFGYESIQKGPEDHVLSGTFYSLAGNEELLKLIERAQVSMYSSGIARAEVFEWDKDYSRLLKYLNGDSPAPLVVGMYTANHAVVTDTSYKPVDLGGGFYAIMCYDCNSPLLSKPLKGASGIYDHQKTYIELDTNTGRWKYYYNGKEQTYSEYNSGSMRHICFYDPSRLSDGFFTDLYTFVTDYSVFFESQDFSVTNTAGDVLFEMVDGIPTVCSENVRYVPGMYGLNSEGGNGLNYLSLPEGAYTYAALGDTYILQISADGAVICQMDSAGCVTVDPAQKQVTVINASEDSALTLEVAVGDADGTVIGTAQGQLAGSAAVSIRVDAQDKTAQVETSVVDGNLKASAVVDGQVQVDRLHYDHEHVWNAWEEVKAPNAQENGQLCRSCKLCGRQETQVIPNNPFPDVGMNHSFKQYILWGYYKGIVSGDKQGYFNPDNTVTRGQFIIMLWRAAGKPEPTRYQAFPDVSENSSFYTAVCWAVEEGITNGKKDGTFGVNDPCTRGHVALFLYRYAKSPAIEGSVRFPDVTGGTYYNAVCWAAEEGITSGQKDGTFGVGNPCKRMHVMKFLYLFMNEA